MPEYRIEVCDEILAGHTITLCRCVELFADSNACLATPQVGRGRLRQAQASSCLTSLALDYASIWTSRPRLRCALRSSICVFHFQARTEACYSRELIPHYESGSNEILALVPCPTNFFFPFKAARKGGTLEVKNLAEEGGKLPRPKVGRTCPVD